MIKTTTRFQWWYQSSHSGDWYAFGPLFYSEAQALNYNVFWSCPLHARHLTRRLGQQTTTITFSDVRIPS